MEFQTTFRRSSSLFPCLPPEIMCMIADQYLNLENPQQQGKFSEYPRAANLDMTFAQINRNTRSAFVHALGERQIMIEILYNTLPEEKGLDYDQLVRELALFLPTSRFENLASSNRQKLSILRIDLGSKVPNRKNMMRTTYRSIFPATPQNILQLCAFTQNHVSKLSAVAFLPQPVMTEHQNVMSQIIHDISNLSRRVQRAEIAFPGRSTLVFKDDAIREMQQMTKMLINPVQNTTDLVTFFRPYQASLQNIIRDNNVALRCLLPTIITILNVWDAVMANGPRVVFKLRQQVQGISGMGIVSNFVSIIMRSVADFLLTQPNTAKDSRHYILIPGKMIPQKHRGNNKFCENPPFQNLNKSISFANKEFTRLRDLLPQIQNSPEMPSPQLLGQVLAIVQDEAHLELALARHKTLPGMMERYEKLRCACEDHECCSAMHAAPREHLERAKRRVALVREYSGRMERGGVEESWLERWLEAFDAVAEKIKRGLEGWKDGNGDAILREPLTEFNGVEFVFQYAP